ncbi:MAG: DUF2971 domain-containing protein [Akkermansia sp.]|nr:DUF2971 domain-containing protein [Akkermansia sp.]
MKKRIRLYHYIKAEHLESFLDTGMLKLTDITRTNDPIEFMPTYMGPSPADYYLLMNILNQFRSKSPFLILSLSRLMSSPSIWGTYADSHKGVCLVFDFEVYDVENNGFCKFSDKINLLKINYSPWRLMLESQQFGIDRDENGGLNYTRPDYCKLYSSLACKGLDWQYEQEYRLDFSALTAEDGLIVKDNMFFYKGLFPYLKGIMLGVACNMSTRYVGLLVEKYRKSKANQLIVDKVSVDKSMFKIVSDKFIDSPSITHGINQQDNNSEIRKHLILADAYLWGNARVEQNSNEAMYHYQQAAQLGDGEAMYMVAILYKEINENSKYIYWLNRAVEAGDVRAICDQRLLK